MSDHYLRCADCPNQPSTHFAVVRDESGEIQRFECARCGGSNVEAGPDA